MSKRVSREPAMASRSAVVEALERLLADTYTLYPKTHHYAEFARLSAVEEEAGDPPARQMIERLSADQATLAASARRLVEAAEAARDQASADLGVRRIDIHEKNAWMLRSHLE